MFASLILTQLVGALPAADLPRLPEGELVTEVTIPGIFIQGEPFEVELVYRTGAAAVRLEPWRIGAGAFEVDGVPLAERAGDPSIELPPNTTLELTTDLSHQITVRSEFRLSLEGGREARTVLGFEPAPEGLDFMAAEVDSLANYVALLRTNQGDILLEFWPSVAPGHVRNFLDLCSSGFYEGVLFHRTSPTFMVQAGCPNTKTDRKNTWGTGRGPRMLEAEFSDRPHLRGVLSMARGLSPNSGSSQFFLMTANSPHLDGEYSAFGKIVHGLEALDRIAAVPGRLNPKDNTSRPNEPQRIEKALVLIDPSP